MSQPLTSSADQSSSDPLWREALAPYAQPRPWRTALDLLTGPVAYLAMWPLMLWTLESSYWITLAISVLAAGFLLRTFIIFHDCTHGSMFRSRRANLWVGRFCGLLVLHPFADWRHSHAVHHGSAGDLDRRGHGDVATMTVSEYHDAGLGARLRLPQLPQPARDVRHRPDLVAGDPAADPAEDLEPGAAQQRLAHQPGGRSWRSRRSAL